MPLVTANGIKFHVQELGPPSPGTATSTVVMVHGLLIGSLASWYFTAAPALSREHRVRMFDLRSHGRSERVATGFDVATLAGDLAALTSDLETFDLVGHSWGALVALRFAIDHPDRVRRLAVVEAPLPPANALQMASFLAPDDALPARLLEALPAQLREQVASGRRQAERLLKSLEYLVLETSLLDDVRAEPDPSDASFAAIRCPTVCVTGDRSSCAPAGERLARAIPGARHVMLSGGHFLHLDARAALTATLEEHLHG